MKKDYFGAQNSSAITRVKDQVVTAVAESTQRQRLIAGGVALVLIAIVGFIGSSVIFHKDDPLAPNAALVGAGRGQQDPPAAVLAPTPDALAGKEFGLDIGGLAADVRPVHMVGGTTLLPPEDVSTLGWYAASALPGSGQKGSTVITGHINSATQGNGFAGRFTQLKAGEKVTLSVGGRKFTYTVSTDPQLVPKGKPLPAVVNDAADPATPLVLITCGGPYVGGVTGYADNVITTATLDPAPSDSPPPAQ